MEGGEMHANSPGEDAKRERCDGKEGKFHHSLDSHAVVKVLVVHGFPAL